MHTDDCSGWTHFIEVSRCVVLEDNDDITVNYHITKSFDYSVDISNLGYFKDKTLITEGFLNIEELPSITEDEAIELAKSEMTQIPFEYAEINVYSSSFFVHNLFIFFRYTING